MNVNGSYTHVQGFSEVQTNSIEKLGSAHEINKASDDASGLAIAQQLGLQKSTLSQAIENASSGIALSNIAQKGISSQKEILSNIREETLRASNGTLSEEGRDIIKKQIEKYLEQYEQVSESNSYNGNQLLKTAGDSTDDISIATDDDIIAMEKADTTSISDSIRSLMGDFTTNPDSRDALLDVLDNGIDELASFASDFGSASNALESYGRNAITAETQTASAKSSIIGLDYAKESENFNKTDLMSQIGYLIQTQANAAQTRNITLLS